MRYRLPTTTLTIFAMVLTVLPAVASTQERSGDRDLIAEETSARAGAPMDDLLERPSAGMGSGASSAEISGFDVVVHGGGWGHGIGMSQWGAQAMALSGSTYHQILSHFYTGVQFGAVKPAGSIEQLADPVRVGVGPNRISVSFVPIGGNGELCVLALPDEGDEGEGGGEAETKCFTTQPQEQWFMYGTEATANPEDTCLITKGAQVMARSQLCEGTLTWTNQPSTRMNFPGINRTYARGKIHFTPVYDGAQPNGRLHVSVAASMDEYLYGLGEVPNSWHMEALKAQVLAARSFALYRIWAINNSPNFPGNLRPDCACQLLATTVDQAYQGWATNGLTEGANNGARWRTAVDETSGQALWHSMQGPTRAMEAYYFSSTGGATENNEDRWGGSPYPYLRSRPDPGATSWTKGFTYQAFANALSEPGFTWDQVTWVDIPARYQSGRPKSLVVHGKRNGQSTTKTYTPAAFAAALGLTSQFVKSIVGLMPEGADKVILHNPQNGLWTLRDPNGQTSTFYYGVPADMALFGDWDGDGISTVGLYRQSDGYVYLRNSNTTGVADNRFYFGIPGDIPVVGDFNGNGRDTVSVYRPSQQRFYITNKLGNEDNAFVAEYSFVFGSPGDVPFAGDWNGDGVDTPGLRRPSDGFVYLRNSNTTGFADQSFFYGLSGDRIFSGDWDADGKDGLGIFRPSNGTVYLRNALSTGNADIAYQTGASIYRAAAGAY